jgi:hypothetical protein
MKKLLFIPFLFACLLSMGQASDSAAIIGKSIKFQNLVVAESSFPKQMNWADAKKACESLGKDWRLPTQYELEILNKNKDKIGGFTNGGYWSSSEGFFLFAWQQAFLVANQSTINNLPSASSAWSLKYGTCYVRAIRGPELAEKLSDMSFGSFMNNLFKYLTFFFLLFFLVIIIYTKLNPSAVQNPNFIIYRLSNWIGVIGKYMPAQILRSRMDKPMDRPALLIIGNLEIYPNDFPSAMEWTDAKEACEALGDGWRLPTKGELNILYQNRKNIGGFDIVNYWSSTEFAYMYAWKQNFLTGIPYFKRNTGRHRYSYNVRAVRTI